MSNVAAIAPLTPSDQPIRWFDTCVPAGFPSPALDHMEQRISLDELLGIQAPHTYLVRVSGDSMSGIGLYDGDVLVVNRALKAGHGDIVVACVNGEVFVKRLQKRQARIVLVSENPRYAPRHIMEGDELLIWGVVRNSIRWYASSDRSQA